LKEKLIAQKLERINRELVEKQDRKRKMPEYFPYSKN
jgi:hypothetical protein